jgi:hypothetical protein
MTPDSGKQPGAQRIVDKAIEDRIRQFRNGRPVAEGADEIMDFLASSACRPSAVILTDGNATVIDLSVTSDLFGRRRQGIVVDDFTRLIEQEMQRAGSRFAFGRYAEDRTLYDNDQFAGQGTSERRTIHMGIDLFCAPDTPVHAPLDARVEIIANNQLELDYGPMLVLRHSAGRRDFFSLYGHLSLDSLGRLREGQNLVAGERIARVGIPPENGNWPPHLHFQLIIDLLGLGKDFPGVAFRSQRDFWLALSPSPAVFFPECDAALLHA